MRKVIAARRQTGHVRTKAKKLYVDVTEEIIMNPDALPRRAARMAALQNRIWWPRGNVPARDSHLPPAVGRC